MRSGDPQDGGGGGEAIGTQDHGGLQEPEGISNQGEVESREQKKEDDENQESHKFKGGSVGSREPIMEDYKNQGNCKIKGDQ